MQSSGFKIFNIRRLECESFQDYLERSSFIMNNLKNEKYTFENIVNISLLYNSVKILKCGYDVNTLRELEEMCKYSGVKLEK